MTMTASSDPFLTREIKRDRNTNRAQMMRRGQRSLPVFFVFFKGIFLRRQYGDSSAADSESEKLSEMEEFGKSEGKSCKDGEK